MIAIWNDKLSNQTVRGPRSSLEEKMMNCLVGRRSEAASEWLTSHENSGRHNERKHGLAKDCTTPWER